MSEWQPIETAPKDGTRILGYDPDALHPVHICYPKMFPAPLNGRTRRHSD